MASSLSFPTSKPPAALAPNPSFLNSARPAILEVLNEHLIPDLSEIIASYAIQGKDFTAEDWKRFYEVEVEPLELGSEFYDWWFQPDAKEATQLNCDTHLPPVLCPEALLETAELPPPALRHRFASQVDRTDYDLETLERLIQNPKEGYPSQFWKDSEALRQNRKIKVGPACYIVARKELFARNIPINKQREYMKQINEETHASYEVFPRALHLATAALAHHVATGYCHLGTADEIGKVFSLGRCEDIVKHYGNHEALVIVGGPDPFVPGVVGGDGPSGGLVVDDVDDTDDNDYEYIGVVGLRKFPGHRN